MESTEVTTQTICGQPTFRVLTFIYAHHLRLILSEIQTFPWVNLMAYRLMEIWVANLAITVTVEFVENIVELFLS